MVLTKKAMQTRNNRVTDLTPEDSSFGAPGALGRRIAAQMQELTLSRITNICFDNSLANASHIRSGKSVIDLMGMQIGKGVSSLVIAAGPSIHRFETAEMIRSSKYEGALVVTESSLSWCLRYGIVPHLVVTVDPGPGRIIRWFGDPNLTEADLVEDDYFERQDMDPSFHKDQLQENEKLIKLVDQFGPQIKIAVSSSTTLDVVNRIQEAGFDIYWWNPMFDDDEKEDSLTRKIHTQNGLPCLNAGGNVGTAAWVFAHTVLGKTSVGLTGIDFGYYSDTNYHQTQYYEKILDMVGPDQLDSVFIRLMNPHLNKEFYTDPAYLWYRDIFLEMAQQADCETHNCTGGGILFGEGIHWSSLEKFLATH